MPKAHRYFDPRSCGAATIVQNQSTVYVNDRLWAVKDTENSHGAGGLIPTGTTVYIEDKLVIVHTPDNAKPDNLCPPLDGEHCHPHTAGGSDNVVAYD
jgi:hypothetical protein